MCILDEIDSGLDVDALRDVAKAVNGLLTPKNSVLMITHYQRLLEFIKPSYIHVMVSLYLFGRREHKTNRVLFFSRNFFVMIRVQWN